MSAPEPIPWRRRDLAWFSVGVLMPLPWVVAAELGGMGIPAVWVAALAGLSILGAAFMLSWSCEIAERDIPQSLALLVLALVGVLPEYAIDLHFAWKAGSDPTYAAYAVANMTGANRLLIGLGWTAVVFVACWRGRTNVLVVNPKQRLELRFLLWATLYSFVIPLDGRISLIDAAVLLALFAMYVRAATQAETHEEEELVGPASMIDNAFGDAGRRLWALSMFVFAAFAIWLSAEPFAEALVHLGRNTGVDEFLLVQWLAPLASESPEFVVAVIFAFKLRGSIGMGALVSSKVNQWTLLVGAIPIAYSLSLGSATGLPLDERQSEELLLTSAQSLLAAVLLTNLRFSRLEAGALAVLFCIQLSFPSTAIRWWFIVLYLVLTVGVLVFSPTHRRASWELLTTGPNSDRS